MTTACNLPILHSVDNAAGVGADGAKCLEFSSPWLGDQNGQRRIDLELGSRPNHYTRSWPKQELTGGLGWLLINRRGWGSSFYRLGLCSAGCQGHGCSSGYHAANHGASINVHFELNRFLGYGLPRKMACLTSAIALVTSIPLGQASVQLKVVRQRQTPSLSFKMSILT